MKPHKGWFSIIQFCPDPNRLESANIGVLLFCPELNFLDVRIASDNRRIRKFFGTKDLDLKLVNSFKKGLAERVQKERKTIVDHEQLLDFVDRRANQIRISPPRSLRVTNAKKQIDELFLELVDGNAEMTADAPFENQMDVGELLAQALEQPLLESKLLKSVSIPVPIDERNLDVPYAFQNGRFNLIQPVTFRSNDPLQNAYRYAVEGNSIYQTEHANFGNLQLLVVGLFKSANHKPIVDRVLEEHHVRLFSMDEVDQLIQEILTTGKDLTPT